MWLRLKRWFVMRFRTRIKRGLYNRHGGRILTTEEWDAQGGWAGTLVLGWTVTRPDWFEHGSTSAVTAASVEEARAALDEWQDDCAGRRGLRTSRAGDRRQADGG